MGLCGGGRTSPCPSLQCRFYFLVLWDHGFHCGTLKLFEGHWWGLGGKGLLVWPLKYAHSSFNSLVQSLLPKDTPLKNIFDFTTAGDWDCMAAVDCLPSLHYSVDFIILSFGIMGFIVEL